MVEEKIGCLKCGRGVPVASPDSEYVVPKLKSGDDVIEMNVKCEKCKGDTIIYWHKTEFFVSGM